MPKTVRYLLFATLLLAAGLRFGALGHGLPWLPQEDEFQVVERTLAMGRGLPDPGLYTWPAGPVFYSNLAVFGTIYLIGHLSGGFANPIAFASWYLADPTCLYLASRGLSALWAVLAVLVAFHLGRRLSSPRAGLMAALATALTPEWLFAGTTTLPDAFAAFMSALCLALLFKAQNRASRKFFFLACLAAGFAVAGKYHTWPIFVALAVTSLWLPKGKRLKTYLWGMCMALVAFIISNPFAALRPMELADNLALMSFRLYGTATSFLRYDWMVGVGLGLALGLPLLLLSGLGLFRAITRHNRSDLIVLAFLIPFLLVVGIRKAPPKFLLPALVPLVALGAAAISDLVNFLPKRKLALTILLITIMIHPAYYAIKWLVGNLEPDSRYTAARVALDYLRTGDLIIVDQMPPDPLIVPLAPDEASLHQHVIRSPGAGGWVKARLEADGYPYGRPTVAMRETGLRMEGFCEAQNDPHARILVLSDPDTPRWRAEQNLEPGMPAYELEKAYRELVQTTARERGWQKLYECDGRPYGSGPKVEVWLIH